ncbi:MAG TPA: discoidin domain-containing protein, partial [Steroidobacter sp.]
MTNDDALLDDFRDIAAWGAVASGEAQLRLHADVSTDGQAALRLEYDFKSGGGFVVARRNLERAMPTAWALSLRVRGAAPANKLEIKLADKSGRNVWWWHHGAFAFPGDWITLRIRSSEVSFAWGPAGGGTLDQLGALEIAIAAGPGGRGTVWISDLRFEDLSLTRPPLATASSAHPGHEPERALDASPATWRAAAAEPLAWFALDFGRAHEYGGLVIDWAGAGAARTFEVECSDDATSWRTLACATQAEGERSYVYLPGGGCSRHLRLSMHELLAGAGMPEIRTLDVRPFDFSRSLADFFHAVAAREPRGHYPRWLYREQSYWTPVGVAGGATAAILNEEGMFEPDRASFSLEPFLHVDGELITWADAEISVSLANGVLPIPSSIWRRG